MHLQLTSAPLTPRLSCLVNAMMASPQPSSSAIQSPDNPQTQLPSELSSLLKAFLETQTELLRRQDENHKEIAGLLRTQVKYLSTLQQQVLSDEKPLNPRKWNDESGWAAVFKSAITQTREVAEVWKTGMDVNLVFIALFLTVVTAFLIPAIQNIGPQASDNTENDTAQPSLSAEIAALLFYSSLIISILTAILSVLMRQWIGKLISTPPSKRYKDRAMRHVEMRDLAEKSILFLLKILNMSLILSIVLFVAGLLYQLWALSASFRSQQSVILITATVGSLFTVLVTVVGGFTTAHAVYHKNSPFSNILSDFLRNIISRSSFWSKHLLDSPQKTSWTSDSKLCYYRLVQETTDPSILDSAAPLLQWNRMDETVAGPYLDAALRVLATDSSTQARLTMTIHLSSRYSNN
ncbi:hypothetical protein SISSUDRAFT_926566 [Sistotremastrum suecicum HHB10207 ss-3]|uniref:DUF6535 domain-containing protein n=1 Tax=Sistotremastrum suecicum HHB10207 ss-3 TaxID=1314776 RepID=A0A166BTR7_9AGAM|nr:hypothetical protein SISSUDRAFT_926566 [Sistotremastrum suecicum HHB10207 ss-3]